MVRVTAANYLGGFLDYLHFHHQLCHPQLQSGLVLLKHLHILLVGRRVGKRVEWRWWRGGGWEKGERMVGEEEGERIGEGRGRMGEDTEGVEGSKENDRR